MSYILDAIRKSEQQRQRNIGPSLHMPPTSAYIEKPSSFLVYALLAAVLIGSVMLIGLLHLWPTRNTDVNMPAAPIEMTKLALPRKAPVQVSQIEAELPEKSKQAIQEQEPISAAPENKPIEKIKKQFDLQHSKSDEKIINAPKPDKNVSKETTPSLSKLVPPVVEKATPPEPIAAEVAQPNAGVNEHKIFEMNELPPAIQQEIPKMSIVGYAYSSTPKESSVGINDHLLQEGDYLVPGLRLEHINADGLVFSYKTYLFRQSL